MLPNRFYLIQIKTTKAMSSSNNANYFISFLSGTVAGTVLGILYAPDKGKHTRDRLSYRLEQYKDSLQEVIDDLTAASEAEDENGQPQKSEVSQETIEKAEKIMDDINSLQETIHNQKKAAEEE